MTPEALHAEAATFSAAGLAHMTLVLPHGWKAPRKFPRGELLCVNRGLDRVYRINIEKLLKWLAWAEAEDAKHA